MSQDGLYVKREEALALISLLSRLPYEDVAKPIAILAARLPDEQETKIFTGDKE